MKRYEVKSNEVDTREWVKDLVREIDELGLAPYGCWPWDCVLVDPSDVVECKQ